MRILAFLVLGVTALSLFSLSVARSTTLPQISDDRGAPCCPNPRFLEPRSKDGYERRAAFDSPAAIAYDADDDAFFIADAASNMIRRYTSNGKVTTVAGACVRELVSNACVGRELDGAGRIARFDSPSAIVYDHGGRRFLVYDTGASALRWVTPDGRVTTIGRVEGITGLAINNRTGMLYGAQGRYVVQISIDGSGASVYRIWSIPGNAGGDAPADNVNDIAIDQRTGDIFASVFARTVYRLSLATTWKADLLAGNVANSSAFGSGTDGRGLAATFHDAGVLAFDDVRVCST